MIFDHGGNVVAVEQLEHEQIYPKPGWVEHDANEVWQRCRQVMDGALGKVGGGADAIAAWVSPTSVRPPSVWDRSTGEPVAQRDRLAGHPHRQDRAELGEGGRAGPLPAKTGLPLATYFSGPKVRWILENVDGARERADAGDLRSETWTPGDLEPDRRHRRRAAHHRRVQREPHDADGPRDARLGRRAADTIGVPKLDVARDPPSSAVYGEVKQGALAASRSPATSATSRRRRSARPASRPARPRTPTARATSCC